MSMKVLIVDPDWRFAEQASNYLESRAHLAVHQPRAKQALTHAQRWQPDLLIVAAEIVEKGFLKELAKLELKPAVLITGWVDRFDRAWRAWQSGGHELLMKPVFKAEEIKEAIITAMENAATGVRRSKPLSATA